MESMVVELFTKKVNRWLETVRQAPERWTLVEWRKVYGFPRDKEGRASQTDRFIDNKFSNRVNSKDGYVVPECKDVRAIRFVHLFLGNARNTMGTREIPE